MIDTLAEAEPAIPDIGAGDGPRLVRFTSPLREKSTSSGLSDDAIDWVDLGIPRDGDGALGEGDASICVLLDALEIPGAALGDAPTCEALLDVLEWGISATAETVSLRLLPPPLMLPAPGAEADVSDEADRSEADDDDDTCTAAIDGDESTS